MTLNHLYDNESEELLHSHAISILQRELGLPSEEIMRLYEHELERLKEHARIKDFLVVLVCRTVRDILRRDHLGRERRNGTTG